MLKIPNIRILLICDSPELAELVYGFFIDVYNVEVHVVTYEDWNKSDNLPLNYHLAIIETVFILAGVTDLIGYIRSQSPDLPILVLTDSYVEEWEDWKKEIGNISVMEVNSPGKKVLDHLLNILATHPWAFAYLSIYEIGRFVSFRFKKLYYTQGDLFYKISLYDSDYVNQINLG